MSEKEFDTINVIPFIDIMLVLLTIVLTTSTFIASGAIRVNLPEASAQKAEIRSTLTIELDQGGQAFMDGIPIPLDALEGRLNSVVRETPILIRADRDVILQHFVRVMDGVKTLGFNQISLQTEAQR